jgi:hypothetical protein
VLVFTWPRDRQVCVERVTLVVGCKFPGRTKWDVKVVTKISEWVSVSRVNEHSFMLILSTMLTVSAFADGEMSIVGVHLHKEICRRKAPCKVFRCCCATDLREGWLKVKCFLCLSGGPFPPLLLFADTKDERNQVTLVWFARSIVM